MRQNFGYFSGTVRDRIALSTLEGVIAAQSSFLRSPFVFYGHYMAQLISASIRCNLHVTCTEVSLCEQFFGKIN